MTNEQILKERWKNTDSYLKNWIELYKKLNRKTQDNIQDLFNSLNIEYKDINKPISKRENDKLKRFILELQENGLLNDYFGYTARLLLNKKNITYSQMLEFMITANYIKENAELKKNNKELFYSVCKDGYEKGIKDIGKKLISFKIPILYTIMNIPLLGITADDYLYSLSLSNATELYKKTLINLQLGKELIVDNKYYKELFQKQQNRYLCINGNKTSGGIENIVENISNQAYLQAGIDTNAKECRFIAEIDKRTTKMCETLNNQIFKLNEMNVYQRYSDIDKRIITYHTKGLVVGENLPPIDNHFHWCRSTITYSIKNKNYTINKNKWLKNAKPGKGIVKKRKFAIDKYGNKYEIDGKNIYFDISEKEKNIAEWLRKKFGGNVYYNPKVDIPDDVEMSDYHWKNDSWDLKEIKENATSITRAVDNAIKQHKNQTNNIILDISKSKIKKTILLNQTEKVFSTKGREWVKNIIVIDNEELIEIYSRK